jgi:hypothetical protein
MIVNNGSDTAVTRLIWQTEILVYRAGLNKPGASNWRRDLTSKAAGPPAVVVSQGRWKFGELA